VQHHEKLNYSEYLPTIAIVTTGKVHEQNVMPRISLEKGDVVVFDREFTNFVWFATLCERGTYFVIHLKMNADYRVAGLSTADNLKNVLELIY
jgi:hypothetical protein